MAKKTVMADGFVTGLSWFQMGNIAKAWMENVAFLISLKRFVHSKNFVQTLL